MIDEATVRQVTEEVYESMLGAEVSACDAELNSDLESLCAEISISGEWQTQVYVVCGMAMAKQIATTMFMAEADELSDEEVSDALGELTNMIGGSLKGELPGQNQLSIPTVQDADFQLLDSFKEQNVDVGFQWNGENLNVIFSQPAEQLAASNS